MPPIRPASRPQIISASVCSSAPSPDPFAPPASPGFITTTGRSVAALPGSVLCPLRVLPLGVLPLAPGQASTCPFTSPRRSFPRSALTTESGSRRLYVGCHLGSKQVSPRLVPSTKASSVSASLRGLSTRSSTVYFRSRSQFLPDALSRTPFPQRSPPRPLCRRSSRWFGTSSCEAAPGDLPPSPAQHHFRLSYLHRINPPCSWRTFCRPSAWPAGPFVASLVG